MLRQCVVKFSQTKNGIGTLIIHGSSVQGHTSKKIISKITEVLKKKRTQAKVRSILS
jgi:hypothetical protein